MTQPEDQQKNNEAANQIFLDIAGLVYASLAGSNDTSIKAVLEFDEQQRVTSLNNVFVDGKPRLSSPDDFEAINKKAADILTLPEMYKIRSLLVEIKNGEAEVEPTYLT